jgi:6-phosphogluconolactonase
MTMTTMHSVCLLLLTLLPSATLAFVPVLRSADYCSSSTTTANTRCFMAAPASEVWILPTEQDVTKAVHKIVQEAAKKAIEERGHFALAIPGGSVLQILSRLEPSKDIDDNDDSDTIDWVSKTTLAYVNHKCVPNDDLSSAIHAKACNMFLDRWGFPLTNVVTLGGSDNAEVEATEYQQKLEDLSSDQLPRDADGFPVFDLCLIGVGDDGHIGSLYPNRDEIHETKTWTVGVAMKTPPSISLTLPVMQRAKQSVVSAAGQSDKYPQGKAAAMRLAMEDPDITPAEFPACALRATTLWILDEPNASELRLPSWKRSTLEDVSV